MAKEYEIIWHKKQPKTVPPSASISARVIALNDTACAPLKDAKAVCLGCSKDKKAVFVKAHDAKTDQELLSYPVKAGGRFFSISCGKFIEALGLSMETRKRMKYSVTTEDGMVIISL